MTTGSPQRNDVSRQSLTAGPDFATWQQENLAKFAAEAYNEILHLQQDLKTAIEAYRALLRR